MGAKITTMPERINEIFKYAIACGKASSRQDLAEKCGITNVSLSRYLNGKAEPSRKTLLQMNDALGKPFDEDWLLTGVGEPMDAAAPLPITSQTPSTIDALIQELREQRIAKDEQIDRLLTIIENMQSK